jgi:hypothetical protein
VEVFQQRISWVTSFLLPPVSVTASGMPGSECVSRSLTPGVAASAWVIPMIASIAA